MDWSAWSYVIMLNCGMVSQLASTVEPTEVQTSLYKQAHTRAFKALGT